MSINFPAATLTIGRDLIRDRVATILSAIKTDDPAAWDHAMHLAQEVVVASKTGHVELRHYHESMMATLSPAEEEAFDELEAKTIQNAHVNHVFAPLLNTLSHGNAV